MDWPFDAQRKVYQSTPGGKKILDWYGGVPTFHDAEVLNLELNRARSSTLRILYWTDDANYQEVVFELGEVIDLTLEGFSQQNVIGDLMLLHAVERPERVGFVSNPQPSDYDLILSPIYSLSGYIRCRNVSIEIHKTDRIAMAFGGRP